MLSFDPRLVSALPLPSTLACLREDDGTWVVVTTSRAAYAATVARRWPVFIGSEIDALALAAEHDRGTPTALREWCARKAEDPTWRLTHRVALGPVFGDFRPLGWPLARVLRAYWLDLRDAMAGDDLPACFGQAAPHQSSLRQEGSS